MSTAASVHRNKPIDIEATQWFKNGDHPDDGVGQPRLDRLTGNSYTAIEGAVVRFFNHPTQGSASYCGHCGKTFHLHGWIDTPPDGRTVCPGDYVLTIQGERYPCKPDLFAATFAATS